MLGGIYDGEPGIDRALLVQSPAGHVFKLFCGMETVDAPPPGDRPVKFEHLSCKVWNHRAEERFLTAGLGFRFSDRMGFMASWWHCDEDHHGFAITRAPRPELSHYAYTWDSFEALGRVADRLRTYRDRTCIWGPSRHGPGNNHFLYLHDEDGAMIECCSEIAQMTADNYQPRDWGTSLKVINQWGSPPPLRFILTGFPIVPPAPAARMGVAAGDGGRSRALTGTPTHVCRATRRGGGKRVMPAHVCRATRRGGGKRDTWRWARQTAMSSRTFSSATSSVSPVAMISPCSMTA